MLQPSLITVIVFRRHYGRRYTDLPVDAIDSTSFSIDCNGTFMRPEHYDLRPGDIARWREGERYVEATIADVHRSTNSVRVDLADAHLLPPEYFPY